MRFLLVALCWCVGCGARTGLLGPFEENAGGAGGSPSAGGSAGNAPGPGGSGPCEWVASEATMAADPGMHQRQPALAAVSDDLVTVASEWFAVEGPMDPPSELRHATFAPWGDGWPSGGVVGPSYLADFDAGVSFAAGASTNGRLALAMSDGGKPAPPDGVRFSLDFGPGSGIVPTKYPVSATDERALFAALTREPAPHHVIGTGRSGVPEAASIFVLTELDNGIAVAGPLPLGCGDDPLSADAVAVPAGWVLGASTAPGYEAAPCVEPGPAGEPSSVYFARVEIQGSVAPCATLSPGPIARVVTASHPAGAWGVWALDDGLVEAVRLDPAGCLFSRFPVTVLDEAAVPSTLGAGALGESLIVAFATGAGLVVRVFDERGAMLFETTHAAEVEPDAIDVVGSPAGDALAVAFSRRETGAASRVTLLRFACRG